jgi:hypothetical protein
VLLHVALSNRPATSHLPFQPASAKRPYDFWQWRPARPYWTFVTYFTAGLLGLHVLFSMTEWFVPYTNLLGYIALTVEATLPLPQLLANWQRRGCKGFRPSVIANWIVGDTFKMWFFFASSAGAVPWAFKICGIFQAVCDLGLGLQWFVWRDGVEAGGYSGGESGAFINGREKALKSPPPEREGFELDGMPGRPGAAAFADDGASGWERQRVGL